MTELVDRTILDGLERQARLVLSVADDVQYQLQRTSNRLGGASDHIEEARLSFIRTISKFENVDPAALRSMGYIATADLYVRELI